jgi:hypothetical protein
LYYFVGRTIVFRRLPFFRRLRSLAFTLDKRVYPSSNQQIPAQFAASSLFTCSCIGMSTERQKQASRENGSKSHGPTTANGKLNSSRNAITHGMLSTTIVLKGESTDRFLWLLGTLIEEFQPQTPFEESLIENMAVARWRQMRIWGMEKAGMDHEMHRQAATMPHPTPLDPDEASADAATRAALAFRTLSDDSRSLELINRYDSRYDRQYYRAHRRFVEVRDCRPPAHKNAKGTPDIIENNPPPTNPGSAGGPAAGESQPESIAPLKTYSPHRPAAAMRHHVSRLCRSGTNSPRISNRTPLKSMPQIGIKHAFPQGALFMSKLLGLIFVLWTGSSAAAATLQQLSMDQIAQSATAIVRAHITGSSASFTGSTIYTHYKLQISETWKGSPGAEVMLPGGVAGGYRQSFPGVPTLQTGAEYVL